MRGHLAAAKAAGMPVSRQQHHRCACRHHLHHVSHCPPLLYTASGIRSSCVLPPPYLPDAALHVEGVRDRLQAHRGEATRTTAPEQLAIRRPGAVSLTNTILLAASTACVATLVCTEGTTEAPPELGVGPAPQPPQHILSEIVDTGSTSRNGRYRKYANGRVFLPRQTAMPADTEVAFEGGWKAPGASFTSRRESASCSLREFP